MSEAHTTDDPNAYGLPLDAAQMIAHTNSYWRWAAAPGRKGGPVTTDAIDLSSTNR